MFYLFNVFAILAIGLLLIYAYIKSYTTKDKRNSNKSLVPVTYPFIENILLPSSSDEHSSSLWNKSHRSSKKCHTTPIMTPSIISIQDPDDIEILINAESSTDKKSSSSSFDYVCPWLKSTSKTGEKLNFRKRTISILKLNVVKRYLSIVKKKSLAYLKTLKSSNETRYESETSLVPVYLEQAMNVIYAEAATSVDLNKLESNLNEVDRTVHGFGSGIGRRFVRSCGSFNFFQRFEAKCRRNGAVPKKEFIDKVDSYDVMMKQKKRLAMLELLLQDNENSSINVAESIDGEDAFIFEGHNKSGMAITFILLLLAENKEAQALARSEVFRVLSKNTGKIDLSRIKEFTYLERCIKESLRLFPPVATLVRYIPEDLHLKNLFVPAGSHTVIHLFQLHRDPNFWTNPEKFDPDRFLPKNSKDRHPYAYLPFSAGPRNCKGQKFALLELKAIVVQILHEFYLEPIDRTGDIELTADPILRTTHPVRTKFVKIKSYYDDAL